MNGQKMVISSTECDTLQAREKKNWNNMAQCAIPAEDRWQGNLFFLLSVCVWRFGCKWHLFLSLSMLMLLFLSVSCRCCLFTYVYHDSHFCCHWLCFDTASSTDSDYVFDLFDVCFFLFIFFFTVSRLPSLSLASVAVSLYKCSFFVADSVS